MLLAVLICICLTTISNIAVAQADNLITKAFTYNTKATTGTTDNSGTDEEENFDREEFSITLNVQRIGSLDVPAIIADHKVYISIKELFDFLRIRNVPSANYDSVSGFFIHPDAPYLIDKVNNKISYQQKETHLRATDLLQTESSLYLRSDFFGEIFGLDCTFDFRSLSVNLNTKIELPAIRDMQQELMRRNIYQLRGERKADTTIRRKFSMLKLGMADWFLVSTQETGRRGNTRAWLGLGGVLAGGELNILLNYNSDDTLNMRQQLYQWHYVNNNHTALRQITAGKIFMQSISSIYAPVIGVQVSNIPTVFRRSYGTYTISNKTEPNWTVELYINNVLINYTKADASGFYTFEVPMVYGNSNVKLRFYGPWGEERTSETFINIPFNFTPLHQFDYNLIAGVVDDDRRGKSLRASFNYGLSRHTTLGGGMEYLSTVTSGPRMPFVNTSIRVGRNLLLSAEHIYGVKSKGFASYRLPSEFQMEMSYIHYADGQNAIITNNKEEKRIAISTPIRNKSFTAFSRLSLSQFKLINFSSLPKGMGNYTAAELLFSSVIAGVSSNMTTYAILNDPVNPLVYSNLAINFRLPKGIRFTPQAQYEYKQKTLSMLKTEFEKNIFNRGYVNVTYQKTFLRNYVSNYSSAVTIGLRYNFSFAQVFTSAIKYKQTVATTQSARGSLLYDSKSNYSEWSSQSNLRRGGLVIRPFLDLNCNGRRDANEPKAFGLKLHINGGRIGYNNSDTSIIVTNLEAYNNYFIELDKSSFDNVAWQMKNATVGVTAEPNSFKQIDIPVAIVGEVSGNVFLNTDKGEKGLDRIIVNIYNQQGEQVAHLLSEADGFFNFIGLAPGAYTARIDATQMDKLQLQQATPLAFTISQNMEGDVVNNLQFHLQPVVAK